jgi:hypothetical protein
MTTPPSALPPDPDDSNDDRASWAGRALHLFTEITGTDLEDALSDLLCDLMHWADRKDECFRSSLERARCNYAEETSAPASAGE